MSSKKKKTKRNEDISLALKVMMINVSIPTNQTKILREPSDHEKHHHHMGSLSTPHSSSSSCSSHSWSSSASKLPVHNFPAKQHQSSFCPPEICRHPISVSSAMPHLANLSILDSAVPLDGLSKPILSSLRSFPAAPLEGYPQSPCAQPP